MLARDRLGVKPLYWAQVDDLVVFASELKSVLASGLVPSRARLRRDRGLPHPRIRTRAPHPARRRPQAPARPPARHRRTAPSTNALLALPAPTSRPARHDRLHEYTEELLELLDESVRLRLMSDVPLGAMLSGGLDSSLIVALMADSTREPVKTFSVGFREDTDNELDDARTIANHFGTDHHELELSFLDDTIDLPDLVWHLDEPLADLSALGFLALSQLARQHVTVALSGQGADELFAGYERYRNAALARRWRRLPPWGQRGCPIAALSRAAEGTTGSGGLRSVHAVDLLRCSLRSRTRRGRRRASRQPRPRRFDRSPKRFGQLSAGDPLATTLYLDAQLALPDDMLHYFDRTSHGPLPRSPRPIPRPPPRRMGSNRPHNLKLRRDTTKYVLKEAAARISCPHSPSTSRRWGFFNTSLDHWLEHQAATLADTASLGRRSARRVARRSSTSSASSRTARRLSGESSSEC